jgi:hypothetical protein
MNQTNIQAQQSEENANINNTLRGYGSTLVILFLIFLLIFGLVTLIMLRRQNKKK